MAASRSEGTWQHLIPAAAEGQWHTRTFALDALLSFAYNSEDADSTKVLMWNNNELRACCFSALAEGRPADVREAAFSLLRSLAFADENKAQMWANEECQAIWCIAGGLSELVALKMEGHHTGHRRKSRMLKKLQFFLRFAMRSTIAEACSGMLL